MEGTQNPKTISTKQLKLTERAQCFRNEALLTLAHHIDLNWLYEAYRRTRKDGAVGVVLMGRRRQRTRRILRRTCRACSTGLNRDAIGHRR